MKKHVIMIVFLLIFQNYLSAQDRFAFKAGINYSAFRDQPDLSLKRGILVGMSRNWKIYKNLMITAEINYLTKGGVLKNITVTPIATDVPLWEYDLHCLVGHLEIPVMLKYSLKLMKHSIYFYSGPSYEFGIKDYSKLVRKRLLVESVLEPDDYRSEYFWNIDPGLFPTPNGGFCLNMGIGIQIKPYCIELRYNRSNHIVKDVAGIYPVKRRSHAINLIFGIYIK